MIGARNPDGRCDMADEHGSEPGVSEGIEAQMPIAIMARNVASIMASIVASIVAIPRNDLPDGPARVCI